MRYCPAFVARASGRRRGLDLTLWLWWPDAGHSLTGASVAAKACRFSRLQSTYNAGRWAASSEVRIEEFHLVSPVACMRRARHAVGVRGAPENYSGRGEVRRRM